MRVGIEVGGTFTDLVAVDSSHVDVAMVPGTPHKRSATACETNRMEGYGTAA